MKNKLAALLAAGVFAVNSTNVLADEHGDSAIVPIEMFACSYNDGHGAEHLDAFVKDFNKWADANGGDGYAAWTLTPHYFGPGDNTGFDFLWLGASKDAAMMGKLQDTYLKNGRKVDASGAKYFSCDSHTGMASVNIKPPPEGKTPETGVMVFSDCTMQEGASFEAFIEASAAWADYFGEQGSRAGIYHWYPVYGGGGENYSFKWIESHANFESLGEDFELFGNGGGYQKFGELFGSILKCDSSRVYIAKSRRYAQLR